MKNTKNGFASLLTAMTAVLLATVICASPFSVKASGGGGGGGGSGGVKAPILSGNWTGTITMPIGTGAFLMKLSQSGTSVSGSAHFGAPVFDATLKLAAVTPDGVQFSGFVASGEGSLPITGVMSPDGTMITGTVVELQQVWICVVFRN